MMVFNGLRQKIGRAFLAALVLLQALAFFASPAGATVQAPIRVGYFAFEGYHDQDAAGNRSGYGYEYLQQMARYTGWTYEYLGYDKSWSDAQRMLEDGEIDLLTSAQKTEARQEVFDFSDEPIGYSSTIFSIKAGNQQYTIDNFASFNGVRVGMLTGNSRNAQFDAFAREKGFTYTPVMFSSTAQLVEALQNESIGAIVTSSLRAATNEWIVSSFGVSPYYVCVRKGNSALLQQVNAAIDSINQNDPGIQNQLSSKYYGASTSGTVAFPEQERSYIAQQQASGQPLRVMLNPDRFPMSYYEDGQLKGIFGETALKILELSGLRYQLVQPADRAQYEEYKAQHKADLCMDLRFDLSNAENLGYRLTDSYYTASISRVTRAGFTGEAQTVAAIRHADISTRLQQQMYQQNEIVFYDTTEQCINAVISGAQDAVYLYTYAAESYIAKDVRHQLSATLMPDLSTSFCIGVGDVSDTLLFSILNRCAGNVDQTWLDSVTLSYTKADRRSASLLELLYTHPLLVVSALLVALCMAGAIIILSYRQHARRQEEERAREIERLFRYVCKEHEKVMEIDLQAMTAREYFLRDDQLCVQSTPYKTESNFMGFMHPEDYAQLVKRFDEKQLNDLIQNGSEFVFEARGREEGGEYRWYIYTLYGIRPNASHPRNFMLFKHDVDDLKRKEEESRKNLTDALQLAREASKAKGTFMSRMSHEIRTPLNAVIGYMQIARDSGNNPVKMAHCVESCEMAARHLLSIINDVLDISSIESGKMKLACEPFDLKSQITSITAIFFNQARQKGVTFAAALHDVTQERVVGDSLRLNQILMNLLSNAVKFTPEGGTVTLSLAQLKLDEENVYMRFCVSDTGIGMSEEYQKRLFQPFEQESAGTAQKYGGTGLGLSITYNLVQMMGGSLQVSSKQGEGTAFTVMLHFGRCAEAPQEPRPQDYSHLRALIVDDDDAACEATKALMKRCKVKCDVVKSGEAAVQQILRRAGTPYKYDLCIMDWNMPHMNGLEAARKIKTECDASLPIVIATAYDTSEFADEAQKLGVDKIISKPLFQSTMFDLLVSTFGKYQPVAAEEEQQADLKGLHVLLAEDNPMNQEIAVEILTKAGLTLEAVSDGQQAVDRFTQSPAGSYDAILMDVQMPVLDGYQATGAIRSSSHPEAKTIPIIAMTANAFTEDVNAALASGMNGHISKPVDYSKLYQALSQCRGSGAKA